MKYNLPKRRLSDPVDVVDEVAQEQKKVEAFDASAIDAKISKLMGLTTFEPTDTYWLDTGHEYLNKVLGSPSQGISKILELAGEEHAGKTLVGIYLAALAQQSGAGVGRLDIERSQDALWEEKWGLDPKGVVTRYPKLVKCGKNEDDVRLQSGEELFREGEIGMRLLSKQGFKSQFWLVDSIATLQTEMQGEAATNGKGPNMRTRNDRALFLSETLPRWAGLAANYGAVILFINQLRDKPGISFGDPSYSPGGRAIKHTCSVRARIRRCKSGKLKKGSRVVGLVSIISNIKNKTGGGSVQGSECGISFRWGFTPGKVEVMSREEAEDLMKGI